MILCQDILGLIINRALPDNPCLNTSKLRVAGAELGSEAAVDVAICPVSSEIKGVIWWSWRWIWMWQREGDGSKPHWISCKVDGEWYLKTCTSQNNAGDKTEGHQSVGCDANGVCSNQGVCNISCLQLFRHQLGEQICSDGNSRISVRQWLLLHGLAQQATQCAMCRVEHYPSLLDLLITGCQGDIRKLTLEEFLGKPTPR